MRLHHCLIRIEIECIGMQARERHDIPLQKRIERNRCFFSNPFDSETIEGCLLETKLS